MNLKNMTPPISRKHLIAITLIIAFGGVAGGFILHSGQVAKADSTHADDAAHDDAEHHNKPATETPPDREEGKVELNDEQIKTAGIEIDKAGPARIRSSLQLPGEIRFNEDRTAHVVPRVAGVVQSVSANLGQIVKKGQVLAVLASPTLSEQRSELMAAQKRLSFAKTTYERERKLWEEKISAEQDYLQARQVLREAEIAVANVQQKLTAIGASVDADGSLNRYVLRAPFDGMVVEKHIALGEAVKEDGQVFTISDLSTV